MYLRSHISMCFQEIVTLTKIQVKLRRKGSTVYKGSAYLSPLGKNGQGSTSGVLCSPQISIIQGLHCFSLPILISVNTAEETP